MENKNRIKCLRKLHRLSQEEFAKQYNVAQTAVSNWEVFRNNIDISIATRIAEDYKVPVEFIYGFEFTVTRPVEQWYPDQVEDMAHANKVCKDFFLFKYGKGVFMNTQESSPNESTPLPSNTFPNIQDDIVIVCRNGKQEFHKLTPEQLESIEILLDGYQEKQKTNKEKK